MKKNFKLTNIFGINSLETLVDFYPQNILELHIDSDKRNQRISSLKRKLKKLSFTYHDTSKGEIDRLSKTKKNQGIFARIKLTNVGGFSDLKNDENIANKNTILILDSIQDPQNLGACIRTACAAGVNSIIINQDGSSPINEHVVNSSTGSLFLVKIYYVPNIINCINLLKDKGFWIYGLDANTNNSIYNNSFNMPTAIILGSEGSGIRKSILDNCDLNVMIPMEYKLDSLNVSVSAGISLYEIKRQQNIDKMHFQN